MPKRRQRTRNRRLSDSIVEQLRQSIRAGVPWVHVGFDVIGRLDLLALIKGHHFAGLCSFWTDEDDEETPAFLWAELRDDIMAEHIKRRPGSRPHCWWMYEAKEEQQIVGYDREQSVGTYNGEQVMREVPEDEADPIYETELDYLERLDLLTDDEKAIFEKYDDIDYVRVSSGMHGQCDGCWQSAREKAKEIDFDLDAQVLPHDTFWIPEALVFECEHREEWHREGIFTVETY